VSFDGTAAYQGPWRRRIAGTQAVTIEVWAYNPSSKQQCIETLVAWGHRGSVRLQPGFWFR
jgi:hypothetical protein